MKPIYKNTPMKLDLQFFGAGVSISGTEVDIDIENNVSYINVAIKVSTSGNTFNNTGSAYVSATITGQNNTYNTGNIGFNIGYNTSKQVYYGRIGPFDHNEDGTLNPVSMSVYCHLTSSTNASNTGSVAMSTIARASTITANDCNIGSSTTITINKNSSAFYTTLQYKFASQTSYTNIVEKTALTGYGWTVPTSFYALIPNAKYGTCTIKAITYSYDGTTYTSIGEKTTTFKATADEETNKPTLTSSIVDVNPTTVALTGDNTKIIYGKSTARINASATARNSATLSSLIAQGRPVVGGYVEIENVSNSWFEIWATDSRGYQTLNYYSPIEGNIVIIQYIPLSVSLTAKRTTPTNNEIKIKFTGNYFNQNFGASSNTLALSWKYREAGGTTWITGGNLTVNTQYKISGNTFYSGSGTEAEEIILSSSLFDYEKSYDIQLIAVDQLTTYTTQQTVLRGIPVWYYKLDEFGVTQLANLKANVAINGEYDTSLNDGLQVTGEIYKNGTPISNVVVNTTTKTSATETYSCNYINGIIESGNNANGEWIKYADGTMICAIKKVVNSVACNQSWNGHYIRIIPSITFPQTFTTIYSCNIDLRHIAVGSSVRQGWVMPNDMYTTAETGMFYVISPESWTGKCTFSIIAIGRWK